MRLSVVFELLLIFVLLAFAASRVIEKKNGNRKAIIGKKKNERQDNAINKYCTCTESSCNCCRDFNVPIVNIKGPGCAALTYLLGDRMSVSLSFADRVITNQTLSGRKPKPVCMPLPGGISKFCGRIYNIARVGEDFKACLGLELQSKKTVEAALRVSCFKFGARGVSSEAAEPLPLAIEQEDEDDDDDDDDSDDDDDDFDIDDDDDDDDDDEEDDEPEGEVAESEPSADYTGFSILGEDLLSLFETSGNKKPSKKKDAAELSTTSTTTKRPRPSRRTTTRRNTTPRSTTTPRPVTTRTGRPSRRPSRPTGRPLRPNRTTTVATPITTASFVQENLVANTEIIIMNAPHTTEVLRQTSPKPISENIENIISQQTNDNIPDNSMQPIQLLTPSTKTPTTIIRPLDYYTQNNPEPITVEMFGIESSLAHITGQLSDPPLSSVSLNNENKAHSNKNDAVTKQMDKVQETTESLKNGVSYISQNFNDEDEKGVVEVVSSFDGENEIPEKRYTVISLSGNRASSNLSQEGDNDTEEDSEDEEDDEDVSSPAGTEDQENKVLIKASHSSKSKKGQKLKNKPKNKPQDDDDDILGLGIISETFGFGGGKKNKNAQKHKDKVEESSSNSSNKNKDDDDILGLEALSETLGFRNLNKRRNKDRKRGNKMMKYDFLDW